ncbi:hypothetical protein [Celeribacter litoreus]|uniref:hypothetical protein n=1 Tax=Celeribacter litoreus TaxID=2876714 RepID=UPI001CCDB83B|nr:hypothetical protein [Celeribacter litoreus]MCA0043605.1 hypothetical protein [Celeribacter litoreus]
MTHFTLFPIAAAVISLSPLQAFAENTLGFLGAQTSLGYESWGGENIAMADGTLDYAITGHHGLQLDLGTTSFSDHWQGTLSAHLYMQPQEGAKYGLFASYTDVNDTSAGMGAVGIEGMWALGSGATQMHMRTGVGLYTPGGNDFIFGDIGFETAVSDQLALGFGVSAYDLEEAVLDVRDITATLSATWSFETAPIDLTMSAIYSVVDDDSPLGAGQTTETGLSAVLTWRPGRPAQALPSLRDRQFDAVRPLTGLFTKGY